MGKRRMRNYKILDSTLESISMRRIYKANELKIICKNMGLIFERTASGEIFFKDKDFNNKLKAGVKL